VNCGIGDAAQNAKGLDAAINDLALITGQRPVKTRARNSVATFKIREGQPLGIAVTLRGNVSICVFSLYRIFLFMYMAAATYFMIKLARSLNSRGNILFGHHSARFLLLCFGRVL